MLLPGTVEKFKESPAGVVDSLYENTPDHDEYLGAQAGLAFERTSLGAVSTAQAIWSAEREAYGNQAPGYKDAAQYDSFGGLTPRKDGATPVFISKEDWNENHKYYRKGIEWHEDFTEVRAEILADDFDKREYRKHITAAGKNTYGFWQGDVGGFFAGMLGTIPDPINFIPFVGGAAKLNTLRGAGRGALSGVISNAAVDALVLPDLHARGGGVTFEDVALDLAFGGVVGGIFGGIGGFVASRSRTRIARMLLASPGDRLSVLAAMDDTIDALDSGRDVNVAPHLEGSRAIAMLQEEMGGDQAPIDFSTARQIERPDFTEPPQSRTGADIYDQLSIDRTSGLMPEEIEAQAALDRGDVSPEFVEAYTMAKLDESRVTAMEETGLSLIGCVMGVV